MKIIKPSFTVHYDAPINYDCVKLIEHGGRICYQSTWKAGENTAKPFTEMLIDRGHTSALEHGAIYLAIDKDGIYTNEEICKLLESPYSKVKEPVKRGFFYTHYCVYTNLRVIQQLCPTIFEAIIERKELPFDLAFFEPTQDDPYRRLSASIVCDRGVSHEIVRNRDGSFSQESTRYCNFSKDQFGNEITVIEPMFWASDDPRYAVWKESCELSEASYFKLLALDKEIDGAENGIPQNARAALPNSLKTEILCTYDLVGWDFFMYLRTAKGAHPQMREIACPMYAELQEKIPSQAWGSRQSHQPKDWKL